MSSPSSSKRQDTDDLAAVVVEKKFDLLVKNGLVVSASDRGYFDIGIKDGKVVTLERCIDVDEAEKVIDAEGGMVMPGGIDAHVHLSQDPEDGDGPFCADNFETGSRSAVCGGTTTMISFAQQHRKDGSLIDVLDAYHKRADSTGSYIDYSYHIIIANPTPSILSSDFPTLVQRGITSVKLFMTYSNLKLSDDKILDVMIAGRKHGVTILLHAENGDIIEWLTEKLEKQGMTDPIHHTHSRPQIVEAEAASRAIVLAELVQSPLVLVHVSAGGAALAIRGAQGRDLPIMGETCPQYLFLKHDDLTKFAPPNVFENSKHVCSPPPGPDGTDQEAIWRGLRNGTFQIFSSDHCPYIYDDKRGKLLGLTAGVATTNGSSEKDASSSKSKKNGNFKYIPNGCPGIETRLPLLFSNGVEKGRITPEKFVEVTSTNVAKLYGLYPRKGTLQPGSDADITIWWPKNALDPFKLENDMLHHSVDYTPYEGHVFTNWPRHTLVRGKLVYSEGDLVDQKPGWGKFVKRGKSLMGKEIRGGGIEKDVRRVATWLDV